MLRQSSCVLLLALAGLATRASGQAAGTAFTYQGQLMSAGVPANGSFDIRLGLYAATSGGSPLGTGPQTFLAVPVSNGLVTLSPDFGPTFDSSARYLQVEVRPAGGGLYTALAPRQTLSGTPYSLGLVLPMSLTGATLNPDEALLNITQTNVGTALNIINNSPDSINDAMFVQTYNGQDAIFAVNGNGQQAILAEANVGTGVVGLGVGPGSFGLVGRHDNSHGIAAGVAGRTFSIDANAAGVTGSVLSAAAGTRSAGVFGTNAGTTNDAYGVYGTLSGTTIGAFSAGVAGIMPVVATSNGYGVFGQHLGSGVGVYGSSAGGTGVYAVSSAGGTGLLASTQSGIALYAERTAATGTGPTIRAQAVSNDPNAIAILGEFAAGSPNSFSTAVRGRHLGTGGLGIGVWGSQGGSGYGVLGQVSGAGNAIRGEAPATGWSGYFDNRVFAGLSLNIGTTDTSGGNPIFHSSGARLTPGGAWTNASDKNLKENFAPIEPRSVLDKVALLPISSWNYKVEGRTVTHIGPTAQDFRQAFNLGDNDTTIATIDADGVALAAIKGLREELSQKDSQISDLRARNADLESRLRRVEAAITRLDVPK